MESSPKKTNWWLGGVAGVIGVGAIMASSIASESSIEQLIELVYTTPTTQETKVVPKPIVLPTVEITPVSLKIDSQASKCHPSYSGCLKQGAGDYDCAGGTGNGPNYTGAVQVYGLDSFDLDRDNDGWGCEK